jgi:hypothetical protein
MWARWLHQASLAALAALLLVLAPEPAAATQKFGPLQISGNLQSENLIRHPNESTYEYIMNRNIAHIQLDYDWLQSGKFYNKYDIPFIESSHLFLKWRGVYDSIYDTTPGFIQKEDIHGHAYLGGTATLFQALQQVGGKVGGTNLLKLSSLSAGERDALRFDNQLREASADIKFRMIPLSVRAGRQEIVWGETDNFRMLDRANTLDLTWHFQQEIPPPAYGWDEIRRPFWMIKFLYDLGDIWKVSQNFVEWYWNPGDWWPAKQAFFPRPWGLPFLNPLTNPFDGAFINGLCATSGKTVNIGGRLVPACTQLLHGTRLFEQGDWTHFGIDNSQIGMRYHGITPQAIEFSLVYFYQRWGGDDGTNYAPLQGIPRTFNQKVDGTTLSHLLAKGIFPAEFIAPYVHSFGLSANYSEESYTQTVYRFETIYDHGIPFFDLGKITLVDNPALPGVTKKDMWKGMIAFDRPTWIKSLNKKSTIFLTGQFFWHYLLDNSRCQAQAFAQIPPSINGKPNPARVGQSCLVGGLDLPDAGLGGRTQSVAFRDKIRDWETLFTLAGFTFYRGGSIVPVLGIAVDPVNQFSMEPFWNVDYVLRDDFVVNVGQHYFVTPRGHSTPIFETWGLAGLNSGRSETTVRVTYQF